MLKVGGQTSVNLMHKLINEIWDSENIPGELNIGVIIRIPKKGHTNKCENWRNNAVMYG